jgi:asparagine synthase (glutamine-hydrolysing)
MVRTPMIIETGARERVDELLERSALRRSGAAGAAGEDRLVLRGDDSGATRSLVYLDATRLARFSDWPARERTLGDAGLLRVDPAGCQFLLAYGLVPPPFTLYSDVYALGAGDRLEIDLARDDARFHVEFPFFESCSRGDADLDLTRLKRLLASAAERALPAGEPAWFMQSSGKDSTGLLVALNECGRTDVQAVTYDASYREEEGPIAAELARRFGLEHQVVRTDPEAECADFLEFAERSPSLCADLTLLAYVHSLARVGCAGGVVLDGLGNDAYMGYVQPKTDAWLAAASLPRRLASTWGGREVPDLGARGAYLLKSMRMYPAERSLSGSRLAPRTIQDLIPAETPFSGYFAGLDGRMRELSALDARAYVRGRIYDGCETMPKGRLAALHRGARAVYPYCDPALIEYLFHLPATERYDLGRRCNKLPLRQLLKQVVGESRYLQEKGSFRFDVLRFVEVNQATIRRELDQARPFFDRWDHWVEFYMRRRTNYVHAYALTTLFMFAAWLNRRPAAVTAPLRDRSPYKPGARLRIEP